jgi:hypothetical protein
MVAGAVIEWNLPDEACNRIRRRYGGSIMEDRIHKILLIRDSAMLRLGYQEKLRNDIRPSHMATVRAGESEFFE